jgi:cobalt-zinc-cadmium efflux system outer membrane protein
LTLERQQAGDLSQVELNIANLAYARARIDHASAESARVGADQLLRAIVPGQLPEVWPELPEALPDVSVEQADADALLSRLPEIQVQRANVLAADARVDLRERERRAKPTVGLMAGTEEDESLIGISFSMPLNVRNRFTYEVAAAQAEKRAAERQADDIEARARGRLITATERYRLTLDAWRSWAQTGQTNLGQQSELLQRLVAAGELSTTDYLVQLNQTLDTAASALELRRQMWLAWLEWLAAAGRIEAWLGISTGD